ncbi:hypothetical protein MSAN_02429500 [Mycena sanguinolenta]|uniref:Uncharacterized protein n=1 Tax=Mycena sanguinolenta TaxID=230812 RepID=A0A8H7CEP1_9AGAR|nr:hypothetical protein MSAN_02429500 [Mycena sanguinolenta]
MVGSVPVLSSSSPFKILLKTRKPQKYAPTFKLLGLISLFVHCLQDSLQEFYALFHFLKSSSLQMLALCGRPSQGRSRFHYPLQPCCAYPCSDYQAHSLFNDLLEDYSAPIILCSVDYPCFLLPATAAIMS